MLKINVWFKNILNAMRGMIREGLERLRYEYYLRLKLGRKKCWLTH